MQRFSAAGKQPNAGTSSLGGSDAIQTNSIFTLFSRSTTGNQFCQACSMTVTWQEVPTDREKGVYSAFHPVDPGTKWPIPCSPSVPIFREYRCITFSMAVDSVRLGQRAIYLPFTISESPISSSHRVWERCEWIMKSYFEISSSLENFLVHYFRIIQVHLSLWK